MKPRGYKLQTMIPCCANCTFGGYLGSKEDLETICICEIMGESDSPADDAVDPLGICDAWKP